MLAPWRRGTSRQALQGLGGAGTQHPGLSPAAGAGARRCRLRSAEERAFRRPRQHSPFRKVTSHRRACRSGRRVCEGSSESEASEKKIRNHCHLWGEAGGRGIRGAVAGVTELRGGLFASLQTIARAGRPLASMQTARPDPEVVRRLRRVRLRKQGSTFFSCLLWCPLRPPRPSPVHVKESSAPGPGEWGRRTQVLAVLDGRLR